jgi:hypothetical protein
MGDLQIADFKLSANVVYVPELAFVQDDIIGVDHIRHKDEAAMVLAVPMNSPKVWK